MTIGEGEVVRGDGEKSIVRIIQFTYSLINEFPNKRITIGEGEVVRGDGVKSIVRFIQFTYSLINEFSNKRITIGNVVFLMPGTPEIANKTAPEVLNISSPPAAKAMGGVPGWQPGDYGGQTKNLETKGEINGWIGIERSIPSVPTALRPIICLTATGPHNGIVFVQF